VRQHFPEIVGVIFAAAVLLVLLMAGEGGKALLAAIVLGTAGVLAVMYARRRQLSGRR
jgi:hypothetical protein